MSERRRQKRSPHRDKLYLPQFTNDLLENLCQRKQPPLMPN